jgi:hypothetical protein
VFAAVDPMAFKYAAKFRSDIGYWVVDVNSGAWKPIFMAQFTDIQPQLYWFTNVMWWGLGPALEIAGLVGVAWLLIKRDRQALVAATFPIAYYAAVAQGIGPFMRYAAPLSVGLSVAAAALCADMLARPRLRRLGIAAAVVVCGVTALYAVAYMNVFRSPDSRLEAAKFIANTIPPNAKILVEPSHNIPPMGSYYTGNVDFNGDYVMWGNAPSNSDRHDYYELHSLDTYRTLYDRGRLSDQDREQYIRARLALADWIVMDDTFLQFYQHLPDAQHHVVKQYYQDLFAGRLGFHLVRSFKTYPSLFGWQINDDPAELTFRLFDHPRVFVFARNAAQ